MILFLTYFSQLEKHLFNYNIVKLLKHIYPRMTTTVETYLNSLPNDILTLDIRRKGIISLSDLTRFKNIEELYCYNNTISEIVNNNSYSLFQIKNTNIK